MERRAVPVPPEGRRPTAWDEDEAAREVEKAIDFAAIPTATASRSKSTNLLFMVSAIGGGGDVPDNNFLSLCKISPKKILRVSDVTETHKGTLGKDSCRSCLSRDFVCERGREERIGGYLPYHTRYHTNIISVQLRFTVGEIPELLGLAASSENS